MGRGQNCRIKYRQYYRSLYQIQAISKFLVDGELESDIVAVTTVVCLSDFVYSIYVPTIML
jgi:hypothetical protein